MIDGGGELMPRLHRTRLGQLQLGQATESWYLRAKHVFVFLGGKWSLFGSARDLALVGVWAAGTAPGRSGKQTGEHLSSSLHWACLFTSAQQPQKRIK